MAIKKQPKRIIFRNMQAPGDVLLLTAAVRDLQKQYPGAFSVDVRTPFPELWENNPWLTSLEDEKAALIECKYPLIHRSNENSYHFIHGFQDFLNTKLGIKIAASFFKGDIHLSKEELQKRSRIEETIGLATPFWLVKSGGKFDFTAKWWVSARLQQVVDSFHHRVLFVQVGDVAHHHPNLRGVIDLRGKTTLRELILLTHHAQGVICPVTLAMHLAAAVETKRHCSAYPRGMPKLRPCVVIAGGREPSHWEAYPGHQYLHTIGALKCCEIGGCWKSRVTPLADGAEQDRSLCTEVVRVDIGSGRRVEGSAVHGARYVWREGTHPLPRCMDMISAEEVTQSVERYFDGGAIDYLTSEQARVCGTACPELGWN